MPASPATSTRARHTSTPYRAVPIKQGRSAYKAQVFFDYDWHTLGRFDNRHEALAAARRVWCSCNGDPTGGARSLATAETGAKALATSGLPGLKLGFPCPCTDKTHESVKAFLLGIVRGLYSRWFTPEQIQYAAGVCYVEGLHGGIWFRRGGWLELEISAETRLEQAVSFLKSQYPQASPKLKDGLVVAIGCGDEFLADCCVLAGIPTKTKLELTSPKTALGHPIRTVSP